jgi:hypothetical protein
MDATQIIGPEELARLRGLLDRQDILDCLTGVSRGIDRFDQELYLAGFHADAVIDAGELVGPPAAVYDAGRALHEHGQSTTLHHLTNHRCDVDGDVAHVESYWLYAARNRDGTNWAAGGRYLDRLERREGAWRIAFRCTVLEWSGAIPAAAVPLFDNAPDAHLNAVPSRSREDPSYRRPLVNKRALRLPANPREFSAPRT